MKNLEIISIQATIGYLVASEDASQNSEPDKGFNLISILKNVLQVFYVFGKDFNTVNKQWKQLLSSKAKFTLGEKKVTILDSVSFLKKIQNLDDILCDLSIQGNILVHLGNLSDKLSQGNQIFILKNFTAQRIKKIAFSQQAAKNVELSKSKLIEFVKKNYRGNWEVLKKHKNVKNWTE